MKYNAISRKMGYISNLNDDQLTAVKSKLDKFLDDNLKKEISIMKFVVTFS